MTRVGRRGGTLWASIVIALALSGAASAYDHKPVVVAGLYGDGWGQTTTGAALALQGRYPGTSGVYCTGAIMDADRGNSSWISGYVRAWDKLVCAGHARDGVIFALIYDQKGQTATNWTIYRLLHVSVSDLY